MGKRQYSYGLATQAIDHALITNSDVRTEHGHGDYNI